MSKNTFGIIWCLAAVLIAFALYLNKIDHARSQGHLAFGILTWIFWVTIIGLILQNFIE